jgi:hypothetical protein
LFVGWGNGVRITVWIALVCWACLPALANERNSQVSQTPPDSPEVSTGVQGGLRIYSDEILPPVFSKMAFGYDRDELCTVSFAACGADADCAGGLNDFCGVSLDSLTPGSQTDIWDLVCDPITPGENDCQATSWDFSGNNLTNFPGMTGFTTTTVEINADETCSSDKCGFSPPTGKVLGREDRGFGANRVPTITAQEFEDRSPQDHTIWFRAAVRNEGVSGGLGKGESRICYEQTDVPVVPLWQFPHCDGQGCYFQDGDTWAPENATTGLPEVFDCDNTIFNELCELGEPCGFPCLINAYADGNFAGTLDGEVVNEGTVTLPSGHTFQALLVRTVAEFQSSAFAACFLPQGVRTIVYLWVVPELGTVVRLQSTTLADDEQDFGPGEDILSEIDVKFGLFPPRSVTVGTVTDTSVQLTWDPGLLPDAEDRIDGFRVHWDTDSGNASSYAFDSVANPGQVSFAGASATISGLSPGTTYFFTVTSVSTFSDQSTSGSTTYESLLFPEQIPAVPVDLPVEVSAMTTGGAEPAGAVPNGDDTPGTQLLVAKGVGSLLDLSWGASCRVTDTDYEVYEGPLGSFANHTPLECSTLGATLFSISPSSADRFYVVVPANAASEGSYGTDSQDMQRPASGSACLPQLLGAPVCP